MHGVNEQADVIYTMNQYSQMEQGWSKMDPRTLYVFKNHSKDQNLSHEKTFIKQWKTLSEPKSTEETVENRIISGQRVMHSSRQIWPINNLDLVVKSQIGSDKWRKSKHTS